MPTTPLHALRYPASTDPADVVSDLLKLATDVDNALGALPPGGAPGGIVAGEAAVWNGTAWVRSSVSKIGNGSLAGYPWKNADIDPAAAIAASKLALIAPTRQVFATAGSGTYTTPAGCKAILVECIGGGGGSPGLVINPSNGGIGGGGGGGAYASKLIQGPAATYAYTVSAGGDTGQGNPAPDTIFGASLVVADGGYTGPAVANNVFANVQGGAGGVAANCVGDVILPGSCAGNGWILSPTAVIGSSGGAAARGGGAQRVGSGVSSAGQPGNAPGGGASGPIVQNSGNQSGAVGGLGLIVVTEFYG